MKPKFYSKEAIGILTLLFSPFLGCILFANNLQQIGKGKLGPYFIGVGIFWTLIIRQLTAGLDLLFQLGISNILGSLLLTYYFWDKYLDGYTFEKKSFWKPTLLFVGICSALLLFQILATRNRA